MVGAFVGQQSASEVTTGSRLVSEAAAKLDGMLEAVRANHSLLESIAFESREQATAIAEVNTAVRQMEQTEAQAVELDQVVAIFHLGGAGGTAKPLSKAPLPAKAKPQVKVKQAAKAYLTNGNAAVDWTEF